nr:hypothetical protein [uncultured Schaedlerella sp.]
MQKILRKRMLRELKENKFRYLALGLLIVLGMYMVIGLVGAADTVIIRTAETAKANRAEDGQFGVFVPLTEKEKSWLEERGLPWRSIFIWTILFQTASIAMTPSSVFFLRERRSAWWRLIPGGFPKKAVKFCWRGVSARNTGFLLVII